MGVKPKAGTLLCKQMFIGFDSHTLHKKVKPVRSASRTAMKDPQNVSGGLTSEIKFGSMKMLL